MATIFMNTSTQATVLHLIDMYRCLGTNQYDAGCGNAIDPKNEAEVASLIRRLGLTQEAIDTMKRNNNWLGVLGLRALAERAGDTFV